MHVLDWTNVLELGPFEQIAEGEEIGSIKTDVVNCFDLSRIQKVASDNTLYNPQNYLNYVDLQGNLLR